MGRAMRILNNPAEDIAILSGAPRFLKKRGTTAYIVWKAMPKPQKNSWIRLYLKL